MSDSSQPKNLYDTLEISSKSVADILKECHINLSGSGVSQNDVTYIDTNYQYNNQYDYSTISNITFGAASSNTIGTLTTSDTITLTGINSYSAFNIPVEWVDTFPTWNRVQDMCEKYPGLKIAFENFKVFYEMVKDDYDNPTPKK